MINPGSVGQPRDGDWRAAYVLFDKDDQIIHFHRTPYNLKAAQDRIFAANLPPRLATRLRCTVSTLRCKPRSMPSYSSSSRSGRTKHLFEARENPPGAST